MSAPEPAPLAPDTLESPSSLTAVVVGGDQETRVLFRGLLRLHHYRVVGEAEGSTHAQELVRLHRPALLLVDTNLAEGSPSNLITSTRAEAPLTRIVLVSPPARGAPAPEPGHPDATLPRPFRIREFATAIAPATGAQVAPSGMTSPA